MNPLQINSRYGKTGARPGQVIPKSLVRPSFPDLFVLACDQRRAQGVKKGPKAKGSGPYQLTCKECGASGRSDGKRHDHLWWDFADSIGWDCLRRMIDRGAVHKIVGCGVCGSHALEGRFFADPLI